MTFLEFGLEAARRDDHRDIVDNKVRSYVLSINRLVQLACRHLIYIMKPVPRGLGGLYLSNATVPIQNCCESKYEQYSHLKFKCRRSFQYSASSVPMSRRSRDNTTWDIRASTLARNTHNLIRDVVENLQVEPNPDKPLIALSMGEFLFLEYSMI